MGKQISYMISIEVHSTIHLVPPPPNLCPVTTMLLFSCHQAVYITCTFAKAAIVIHVQYAEKDIKGILHMKIKRVR